MLLDFRFLTEFFVIDLAGFCFPSMHSNEVVQLDHLLNPQESCHDVTHRSQPSSLSKGSTCARGLRTLFMSTRRKSDWTPKPKHAPRTSALNSAVPGVDRRSCASPAQSESTKCPSVRHVHAASSYHDDHTFLSRQLSDETLPHSNVAFPGIPRCLCQHLHRFRNIWTVH